MGAGKATDLQDSQGCFCGDGHEWGLGLAAYLHGFTRAVGEVKA